MEAKESAGQQVLAVIALGATKNLEPQIEAGGAVEDADELKR